MHWRCHWAAKTKKVRPRAQLFHWDRREKRLLFVDDEEETHTQRQGPSSPQHLLSWYSIFLHTSEYFSYVVWHFSRAHISLHAEIRFLSIALNSNSAYCLDRNRFVECTNTFWFLFLLLLFSLSIDPKGKAVAVAIIFTLAFMHILGNCTFLFQRQQHSKVLLKAGKGRQTVWMQHFAQSLPSYDVRLTFWYWLFVCKWTSINMHLLEFCYYCSTEPFNSASQFVSHTESNRVCRFCRWLRRQSKVTNDDPQLNTLMIHTVRIVCRRGKNRLTPLTPTQCFLPSSQHRHIGIWPIELFCVLCSMHCYTVTIFQLAVQLHSKLRARRQSISLCEISIWNATAPLFPESTEQLDHFTALLHRLIPLFCANKMFCYTLGEWEREEDANESGENCFKSHIE